MGNQRNFLESGGFSEYLYETVGEVVTINGLRCKIIKMLSDTNNHYAGVWGQVMFHVSSGSIKTGETIRTSTGGTST